MPPPHALELRPRYGVRVLSSCGLHDRDLCTYDEFGDDERTLLDGVAQFVHVSMERRFDIVEPGVQTIELRSEQDRRRCTKASFEAPEHSGTILRSATGHGYRRRK